MTGSATMATTGPRWPRWVLRVTSTVAAVMLFDQAIFAGQFLAGTYGALVTHRENASLATISVLASTVGAALVRWPGRGPYWPIAAHLGLFGLIGLQILTGDERILAVHVPLGVLIILLASALAYRAWQSDARR